MRVYGRRQVGPGQSPTPDLGRAQDTTAPFAQGLDRLGGGVAQGSSQISAALRRRQEEQERLELRKLLFEADTAADRRSYELEQLKGRNSAGQARATTELFTEDLNSLAEQASSPRVRELFDLHRNRLQSKFGISALRYEDRETERVRSDDAKHAEQRSLEQAADPDKTFQERWDDLEAAWVEPFTDASTGEIVFTDGPLGDFYKHLGVSKGVAEMARRRHFAKGFVGALDSLVTEERFDEALALLDEVEKRKIRVGDEELDILPELETRKIRKKIEEGALEKQADTVFDGFVEFSRNTDLSGNEVIRDDERYVRLDIVRAEIAKVEDPKLRAALTSRLTAFSRVADAEFTLLSTEKFQIAHRQGFSTADGSWHSTRLGPEGRAALDWMAENNYPLWSKLMAEQARTNEAYRARTEAERKARLEANRSERERRSHDVFAQLRIEALRNPDAFRYEAGSGDSSIQAILAPYAPELTDSDYKAATNFVVGINKPKVSEFVNLMKGRIGSLPQHMLLAGQKGRIEAAMTEKLYTWLDESPGEVPDVAWIDTNLTKTLGELGIQVTGAGAGAGGGGYTWGQRLEGAVKLGSASAFSGGAAGSIIPGLGTGVGALTLGTGGLAAGAIDPGLVGIEPADPIKLTPEAAYDLGAREYQKRLRQPLPVEQAIRDPVTGRIDPRRQSAVRALQEVGEPITELNLLHMLGEG